METIIGFIAGYLVGSREGRAGLQRLRESVDAIRHSPEVRRLAGEAVTVAGSIAQQASSRGLSGLGGNAVRTVIDRATADASRASTRAA